VVTWRQLASTNLCAFTQQSREENSIVNSITDIHDKSTRRGGLLSFSQQVSSSNISMLRQAAVTAALVVACTAFSGIAPAHADGATKTFKLPPIDYTDQNRCILRSSNMGQANAARDKLVDLRECKIPAANARGFDLSGVLMYVVRAAAADFFRHESIERYPLVRVPVDVKRRFF
jgi:hypothetical protein